MVTRPTGLRILSLQDYHLHILYHTYYMIAYHAECLGRYYSSYPYKYYLIYLLSHAIPCHTKPHHIIHCIHCIHHTILYYSYHALHHTILRSTSISYAIHTITYDIITNFSIPHHAIPIINPILLYLFTCRDSPTRLSDSQTLRLSNSQTRKLSTLLIVIF